MTGRTINKLHIVGGGSQSKLLNQFAADATGRTVLAGPVEATAIGNVLIQAIAMGELKSLAELRQRVSASFEIDTFVSHPSPALQKRTRTFHGNDQMSISVQPFITVQQHILEEQKRFPGSSGEFSSLLSGITMAAKMIQDKVRRAGLSDILGSHGKVNA